MDGDYIVLNRKILQWEWFKNANTFRVFIYCLLKANWKDGKFEGTDIPRGTFVTSLPRLSADLSLSIRQVRVALNHLKTTGELTVKTTSKFSLVTVNNYDQYQMCDSQLDSRVTGERQASDSQMTGKRQANDSQMTGNKEEEMNGEEKSGDEKGTKEERERTKEKEESGLKAEERKVEDSKGEEGEKREKENLLKKEILKKENSKSENMEQMYQRVSIDYVLSDPLYDKLKEWFKYKQERHQTYKERGMRSLLKQAVNSSHEYGDMAVCDLIDFSMQSNYQGIFWERLTRKSKKTLDDIWRDV